MAKTVGRTLSAEKLRELARAGAEVTLRHLRAEIVAIERTFPGTRPPKASPSSTAIDQDGDESHAAHVGRRNVKQFLSVCSGTGLNAERRRGRSSSWEARRSTRSWRE